jgi:hypothetical protein
MTNPDPAVLDPRVDEIVGEVSARFPDWEPSPAQLGFARACVTHSLHRAQPDPAMVEEIERDIRIAVWNTCRWQGKPQEVAQSFIQHLFADEPCMTRAIAALSKPSTSPATPEKQGGGMG